MGYTAQTWVDGPAGGTPISAARLNHMEDGIFAAGAVFNVQAYGAVGDGSTDDTAAISAALDAGRGADVYLPPGVYLVTLFNHPDNAGYHCGVLLPPLTRLRGAGKDATIIRLANGQTLGNDISGTSAVVMNEDFGTSADYISVEDLTIDGNADNQAHNHGGIGFLRTRGMQCSRVKVMNCRGTGTSGTNETFHFDVSLSGEAVYEDCEVIGTATLTASGFSCNGSTGVRYTRCLVSGMTVTNGFTHNGCRSVHHTDCVSILNAGAGFNSEVSDWVTYTTCTAGGRSSTAPDAYPYGNADVLGNGGNGYTIVGSTGVQAVGCIGRDNDQAGFYTASNAEANVQGGDFGLNNYGVSMGDDASVSGSRLSGNPAMAGNTVVPFVGNYGNEPYAATLRFVSAPPAIPASGTETTNKLPFPVIVYFTGGTVIGVHIDTVPLPDVRNCVRVQPGGVFKLYYSVVPDYWSWQMDLS